VALMAILNYMFPTDDISPILSDLSLVQAESRRVSQLASSGTSGSSGSAITGVGQKDPKIRSINLLGERNSGTRWTYAHLMDCFNHSIPVHRSLTRYKHWFQYENKTKIRKNSIVIAQFRNPYDWTAAMHKVPHHASKHIGLKWKEFVTKEWTAPRIGLDLEVTNKKDRICQERFKYNEIVSCIYEPLPHSAYEKIRYSEHQPIYELKPNGKPYKNILEMRAAKIRNFLDVKNYANVHDVWTVQYEYLLKMGTRSLIHRIEELTGVEAKCDLYEPQERRKREIPKDFVSYLTKHIDWEAEQMIGYEKRKSSKD